MSRYSTIKGLDLNVHDLRAHVNLGRFTPEFARLAIDPYVKEGFRRKHILHLKHQDHRFDLVDKNVLYQDSKTNPIHGGIHRVYPKIESWWRENETMTRLMRLFVDLAEVPNKCDMLVQFQRVTCIPGKPGEPSVENWHRDAVDRIGVVCMARDNVRGGISQFKNDKYFHEMELPPGFMVTFRDAELVHRVTEICSEDGINEGARDVILLASY